MEHSIISLENCIKNIKHDLANNRMSNKVRDEMNKIIESHEKAIKVLVEHEQVLFYSNQ